MKIALAQMNPTVGDLDGNADLIAKAAREAAARGADLVAAPELALFGYLPRDLLLDPGFVARGREALGRLAKDLAGGPPALIGMAEPNEGKEGRPLFNAAVLASKGKVAARFRKTLLPTYDVFDEDRYFEPASEPQILDLGGRRIGITICEDVWNDRDFWQRRRYRADPVEQLAKAGADVILNLSASPFTVGKQKLRERMLGRMAARHKVVLLYCNQVGGNDDLVFDGRSCAFGPDGKLIARARSFEPDLLLVDADSRAGDIAPDDAPAEAEVYRALVLGTRDFVRKCGFSRGHLGLSGGIDSSVTAVVAADALGKENVMGVLMPSPFSSEGSVADALDLAGRIGIRTLKVPISEIMASFERALAGAFAGRERDVTEENIQARIRGTLLMALSNKFGSMLLTTGNKSEMSVGYCTLYGDMDGGLAVISDVPKTMVYRIARWLNSSRTPPPIPRACVDKAPSAELRPDQTDQDSLPPYDALDEILELHIEKHLSAKEIAAKGHDEATVLRVLKMVRNAEFKRKQAPPGLKVTDRAFGTGWRMPIARK